MHKPSFDPDSPDYSNDDPDWDGHEQFRAHTIKALGMVEGLMAKVQIWFDDQGLIYCRDCAKDAKTGGARLRQSEVSDGLVECAGCRRVIKNESDLWR